MRFVFHLMLVALMALAVSTREGLAAGNNENNPHTVSVNLGSLGTDDTQVPVIYFSKKTKIKSIRLVNGDAAIAASDSNYVEVSVKNGSTVVAELDSRAAHENGLVALTSKAMNVVVDELAAGTDLHFDYQETGTVTLTDAKLVIEYFPL